MTRLALLLCLLSAPVVVGCASAPKALKYSGTPAPPAPAFNPALDAPHTMGQPGYVHPEVPRAKDARILPATEDSRIYASDGGEKKRDGEVLPPLPMPDNAELALTTAQWDQCVAAVGALMSSPYADGYSPHLQDYLRALTPQQRACLRERLMRSCVADSLRESHASRSPVATAENIAPALMRALQRRIAAACEGIPMDYRSAPVGVLALDLGSFGYQLRWNPANMRKR